MGVSDLMGGIGLGNLSGIGSLLFWIVIGILALGVCGLIFWFFWNKKKWNLIVTFKLPRSVSYGDGKTDASNINCVIDSEDGKGAYDSKRGVVFLKRKGKSKIAMRPFNLGKYLQGGNKLEVIQTGAETYEPVMPCSYTIYEDEHGATCALINLKAEPVQSKSWKASFEREAKSAFSIGQLLKEYAPYIMIGLVIVLWGIQLLILYNKIK